MAWRSAVMRYVIATIAFFVAAPAVAAGVCDGVDRTLSPDRKRALAPIIASQLKSRDLREHASDVAVEVLKSFKLDGWSIVYVSTGTSDGGFLFYSGDPLSHEYLTIWGGAARRSEENAIRKWAIKSAKGIPATLASCFAWYVTQARDK